MLPLYGKATDVATKLALFLPKNLNFPNGDSIPIRWYDAEEVESYGGVYPYGTMAFMAQSPQERTTRFHKFTQYGDTARVDTFTYTASGTYPLVEKDVYAVTTLTGTVSGVAHTFVLNTDYKVSKLTDYTTDSQVVWLSGVRPDASTSFSITYQARRGQEQRRMETYTTVRLGITCKDMAAGVNGATIAYGRSQVAEFALDWLLQYLRVTQGKGLGDTPREIINKGPLASGYFPYDPGESVRRAWIDLQVCRRMLPPVDDFGYIGKTERNTTSSSL